MLLLLWAFAVAEGRAGCADPAALEAAVQGPAAALAVPQVHFATVSLHTWHASEGSSAMPLCVLSEQGTVQGPWPLALHNDNVCHPVKVAEPLPHQVGGHVLRQVPDPQLVACGTLPAMLCS